MSNIFYKAAKTAHEVNKAYCLGLGDATQKAWEDAPEWQRASALNGVKHVAENPNAKPSDTHKSWLRQKKDEGWQWGPVKDANKKEHPCMVQYNDLPKNQRIKDSLFLLVVKGILEDS